MALAIHGEPLGLLGVCQRPELWIRFQNRLSGIDEEPHLLTHSQDAIEGLLPLIRSGLALGSGIRRIHIDDDAPESRVAMTDDLAKSELCETQAGHASRMRRAS